MGTVSEYKWVGLAPLESIRRIDLRVEGQDLDTVQLYQAQINQREGMRFSQ